MWSPDGQYLYFNYRPLQRIFENPVGSGMWYYKDADSLKGIYSLNVATGTQRRMYGEMLSGPDLSPDGRTIYYQSQAQIWRIAVEAESLNGSSAVVVTNAPDGAFAPSIDSRGTRLLYNTIGTSPQFGIYLTGSNGGATRRIGGIGWFSPHWQPNDSSFAFVSGGSVVRGIGIVDTFGIGAIQLRGEGNSPRWSPDGTRIAFLSRGGNPDSRDKLWIMNRDGSQARQLTNEGLFPGFNWSPDGTLIAYVRFVDIDTSYVNGTIWTVNPTTLARTQMTANPRL
jgi:Tol biopolymer transport system component